MAAFTNPAPPLPPEIRGQQAGAGQQIPMMLEAGQRMMAGPAQMGFDPMQMLSQKIAELSQVAMDVMQLTKMVHPPLAAFLVPIAQAGKALEQQVEMLKQKSMAGPGAAGQPVEPNPAEAAPVAPLT
jgi:hypothetical protein